MDMTEALATRRSVRVKGSVKKNVKIVCESLSPTSEKKSVVTGNPAARKSDRKRYCIVFRN